MQTLKWWYLCLKHCRHYKILKINPREWCVVYIGRFDNERPTVPLHRTKKYARMEGVMRCEGQLYGMWLLGEAKRKAE